MNALPTLPRLARAGRLLCLGWLCLSLPGAAAQEEAAQDGAAPDAAPQDGAGRGGAPPPVSPSMPAERTLLERMNAEIPGAPIPEETALDAASLPVQVQATPPVAPAAPSPALAGGVAVELVSVRDASGTLDLYPRVSVSQRAALRGPLLVGADLVLAPQTGTDSFGQVLVGLGFKQAFSHAYGAQISKETRYKDSWTLAGGPRDVNDPIHAYTVVEGGQAVGWTVDVRSLGVLAGPRLVVNPNSDAPVSIGGYAGVLGLYQRAPGWVDEPAAPGRRVKPEASWLLDAGVLYQGGELWGEIGVSAVGGPNIVGFAWRHVYGRLGARFNADTFQVSLGIGTGTQRNRHMEILPLTSSEVGAAGHIPVAAALGAPGALR